MAILAKYAFKSSAVNIERSKMLLDARLDQLSVLRKSCHNYLVSLAVALLSSLDLASAINLPIFLVTGNAESTLPWRSNLLLRKALI